MINSKFANWYRQKVNYEDMYKFASLGAWVLNGMGAEISDIEMLIGKYPNIEEDKIDRELTEEDLIWIEFAKANNRKYTITENGIKLG